MNSFPFSKPRIPPTEEYSLPISFKNQSSHEQQNAKVMQWKDQYLRQIQQVQSKMQVNSNDLEYAPVSQSESEESMSSYATSYRSSGYDPLENLEEYMKMRDKL